MQHILELLAHIHAAYLVGFRVIQVTGEGQPQASTIQIWLLRSRNLNSPYLEGYELHQIIVSIRSYPALNCGLHEPHTFGGGALPANLNNAVCVTL